jgi:hypothetical protein
VWPSIKRLADGVEGGACCLESQVAAIRARFPRRRTALIYAAIGAPIQDLDCFRLPTVGW